MLAGLASRLADRGHAVSLITLDDGSRDRHAVDDRVCRKALDVMGESRGLFAGYRNTKHRMRVLHGAIADLGPDVVLSFCDRTNILTLLAVGQRFPVVVSERSDPSEQRLGRFWETMRRRQYRRAAAVVALTDTAANYLHRRLGRDVIVIPSAIDLPPRQSIREQADGNRRIVAVGRLEYEKGFDRLLVAFSDLVIRAPQLVDGWTLRIIGDGSMRGDLEQAIHGLGLSDRVSLAGWIQPVWNELADSTFFVLPSRYEGFPSALLEAMAVGLPSLAVDCESGPRAVIRDGHNGLLVANDISSLTDGMLRMIQHPELREKFSQAARPIVDAFNWDAMVDAYERVLEAAR